MRQETKEALAASVKLGLSSALFWPWSIYEFIKYRRQHRDDTACLGMKQLVTLLYVFIMPPVALVMTFLWYAVIWHAVH